MREGGTPSTLARSGLILGGPGPTAALPDVHPPRSAISPLPASAGSFLTESTLGTVHPFVSKARFLDPERTRMASEAFDLALESLGETGYTLPSHRVRHLIASFIVERVMYDDAEPEQLALEAVESLDIIEQARA